MSYKQIKVRTCSTTWLDEAAETKPAAKTSASFRRAGCFASKAFRT
jgi:hypothetical protein